jgi:hypothetical protein
MDIKIGPRKAKSYLMEIPFSMNFSMNLALTPLAAGYLPLTTRHLLRTFSGMGRQPRRSLMICEAGPRSSRRGPRGVPRQ